MSAADQNFDQFKRVKDLKITGTEQRDKFTVYIIDVFGDDCKWTVKHRYRCFDELNSKLVSRHKLPKNLLPPKKFIGNLSKSFVEKRQGALENYLLRALEFFTSIPKPLSQFLLLDKYEIYGVSEALAEELFTKGEQILTAGEVFHSTPMQLYAVTKRLQLPVATCESDARGDLGHIMDFAANLKYLKVTGFSKTLDSSTRTVNHLPFDLSIFKSLVQIRIDKCNAKLISGFDVLKKTLKTLNIHGSVETIGDILLVGANQLQAEALEGATGFSAIVPTWNVLTTVDFSRNKIKSIDESVKLMPRVEFLDLSHNQLECLQHLQHLSHLTHLNLANNKISSVEAWNTKLGNVKTLDLSANKLDSLEGLAKIYSLVNLNINYNEVSQVTEVKNIGGLPCLEQLSLAGNPVTMVTDYRTKVLQVFTVRAKEVCLDGRASTQKELDTVQVLNALHKAKEMRGKSSKNSPNRRRRVNVVHEAEIAESPPPSPRKKEEEPPPIETFERRGSQEDYKRKIETIRQQGGDSWLKMLNAMDVPAEDTAGEEEEREREGEANASSSEQCPANPMVGDNEEPASCGNDLLDIVASNSPIEKPKRPQELRLNSPSSSNPLAAAGISESPAIRNIFTALSELSRHSQADFISTKNMLYQKLTSEPGGPAATSLGEYLRTLSIEAVQELVNCLTSEAHVERVRSYQIKSSIAEKMLLCIQENCLNSRNGPGGADGELEAPQGGLDMFDVDGSYSAEALEQLGCCSRQPAGMVLPEALQALGQMGGRDLAKYFHQKVAKIRNQGEVLALVGWSAVVAYLQPQLEIPTCLMLSNRAVYLLTTEESAAHFAQSQSQAGRKTHRRMHSDTQAQRPRLHTGESAKTDVSVCSTGMVLNISDAAHHRQVRCYLVLELSGLTSVVVGLFDQSYRLSNGTPAGTVAVVTRNHTLTQEALDRLTAILTRQAQSPTTPDVLKSTEFSYYRASRRVRSVGDDTSYISGVLFVYPSEETVSELLYVLAEKIEGMDPHNHRMSLLHFALLLYSPSAGGAKQQQPLGGPAEPRTLVVTNTHLALCRQECVSYPLPDFARLLPADPQYQVLEVRNISQLRRLVLGPGVGGDGVGSALEVGATECLVVLDDDLAVDVSQEHFGAANGKGRGSGGGGEEGTRWRLTLQTGEERDHLVKLLQKQWSEVYEGEQLPVEVETF